ncbi:LolA family protein [Alkalibacillus haloalkaliphilus]|uniref:LolA family protein n=1 Tax=Alkalibacillus haloalkaliphilus TaxID=94136 RepID=UPI002935BFDE|nr:outer membrane lipoprotein carrier protein LolA [Alkalibacillus haloalkaliphilus]MDV2583387.1 outer membrane lipoprotein carrier protein LolA [Alkalibacillus haloalkaliphilus]
MKRKLFLFLSIMLTAVLLTACGEETVDDVLQSLDDQVADMSSFKASAEMTMTTGEESQQYQIDVWHKKEDYFKVVMNNMADEQGNQVILRNDEGVFVLTPSINKSYKFQNDWPKQHSQPYLYTSLVSDIISDSEREFQMTDNYYVFKVKTNYKGNQQLPFQEVYFHKGSYDPALVRVQDHNGETIVEVDFTSFEFDVEISDEEFDTEQNLAEGAVSVPTMAELEDRDMEVYFPSFVPEGVEASSEEVVDFEDGERVILSYEGEKPFTLVQERFDSYPTSLMVPVHAGGDMVDLGFAVGHLTNNSLEWELDGMRFVLASESLTVNEMVHIAQSVESQMMK